MSLVQQTCEELLVTVKEVLPEAVVDYAPEMLLEDINERQTVITPDRAYGAYVSRNDAETRIVVSIAVVQRLTEVAQLLPLLDKMEALTRAVRLLRLSIGPVVEFRNDPLYDMDVYRNDRVFISVVTVQVKPFNG